MTKQDTLTRAIHKAIDGGWLSGGGIFATNVKDIKIEPYRYEDEKYSTTWVLVIKNKDGSGHMQTLQKYFFFEHDFAKSLWGHSLIQHMVVDEDGYVHLTSTLAYEHHLQRMVIAEDPITYLTKNI